MDDLSVLDVQRILRQHAQSGHDITSHPHISYVEGQPYRMRAYGSLSLTYHDEAIEGKVPPSTLVRSVLTQSERPVVSHVTSWDSALHRDYPKITTSVGVTVPFMYIHPDYISHNYYHPSPFHRAEEHAPNLTYNDDERVENEGASSIHEALKNHQTAKFNTIGKFYTWVPNENRFQGTSIKNLSEFPHPWEHATALRELGIPSSLPDSEGFDPYSGLIRVTQSSFVDRSHHKNYVYSPQTEALVRVQ